MSAPGHVISPRFYLLIFGTLLVLTLMTTAIAYVDLGPLNPFVALAIACVKATLVVLFFMHVKYSSRLVWIAAASGFFWLHILFAETLMDYLTRGLLAPADW